MTLENECMLAPYCAKAGVEGICNETCFPYTRLHGMKNGSGGLIGVSNLPKKYRETTIQKLPFEEANPQAFKLIQRYGGKVVEKVDEGVGLYLFGVPSKENTKGTGTGKTIAASALLMEYIRQRTMLEAKKERSIDEAPAFFVKTAKFQNLFNSQFRGSYDTKDDNADQYLKMKRKMMKVDLLVVDDIGLRGVTESFSQELYEVIDERDTNERATIFTSNVPIDKISEYLGNQVASRIEGMTVDIPFKGKDNRKKSL